MIVVYGSCVEPEGMELDNLVLPVECPKCGNSARYCEWEHCEGGVIERYGNTYCAHCEYFAGDDPDIVFGA